MMKVQRVLQIFYKRSRKKKVKMKVLLNKAVTTRELIFVKQVVVAQFKMYKLKRLISILSFILI